MTLGTLDKKLLRNLSVVLCFAAVSVLPAQESHVGTLTGHAAAGK
ncbi:MAG: hypothetical protein QOK07_3353, partial [Gemmatimonadaceae bacterium]|nr:hypothetical protein [Gemmatimonadaceae bacterium]